MSVVLIHEFSEVTEKNKIGLPLPSLMALAYSFQRFCILKFTKPVDEHNLQVPARAASACNAALTSR